MNRIPIQRLVISLIAGGLFAVLFFDAGEAPSQGEPSDKTRATMRGIFNAITTAYQYSLDPDMFENPVHHDEIQTALNTLAENTGKLEGHGGGLDVSFDYMRRSLANDAREAAYRFEKGNYIGSRFTLQMMTENCVTCHTKLPAAREFDLGARFVEKIDLKRLPPVARVNLEITTRQFETARSTWEEVFADPKMTPETLDLYGAFASYLRINIGALDDIKRPIATFKKFNERDDMPASLKDLVSTWIQSLDDLSLDAAQGTELARARTLIGDARNDREFKRDRVGLVNYIAAASLLHRFLSMAPGDDVEVSEAFFLLAVAESKVSRSYWVSESEYLLARSIRRAPKSAVAKEAYDFLEAYTLSAHHVKLARQAPPEVAASLEELHNLIQN